MTTAGAVSLDSRRGRAWKIGVTAGVTFLAFVFASVWTMLTLRGGTVGYFLMSGTFPLSLVTMSAGVTLNTIGRPLLALSAMIGIAQFALYGWIFGRAWLHGHALKGACLIVAAHVAMVVLALVYYVLFRR